MSREPVPFIETRNKLIGQVLELVCPDCRRASRKLYFHEGRRRWGCHGCCGGVYRSRRASLTDTLAARLERINDAIGRANRAWRTATQMAPLKQRRREIQDAIKAEEKRKARARKVIESRMRP